MQTTPPPPTGNWGVAEADQAFGFRPSNRNPPAHPPFGNRCRPPEARREPGGAYPQALIRPLMKCAGLRIQKNTGSSLKPETRRSSAPHPSEGNREFSSERDLRAKPPKAA